MQAPLVDPTQTPTPANCVTSLSPSFVDREGCELADCVDVMAPSNCCWVPDGSLQITSGNGGCGNGRVCYDANLGGCDQFPGCLQETIGGQLFEICLAVPTPAFTPMPTPTCPPSQFTPSPARQPGDLDIGFGTNGFTLTRIGAYAEAYAVAIQADEKLVVSGPAAPDGGFDRFAVARYNADGSLDEAFGVQGVVTTVIGSSHAIPHAMSLQPDGRILVAGESYRGPTGLVLARYTADGVLDTTFGTSGIHIDVNGGSAQAVIIQPDDKLVAAGTGLTIRRYLANGAPDPTFGLAGATAVPAACGVDNSNYCSANGLALQTDGKIVAAGTLDAPGGYIFVLARYTSDGGFDPDFGTGGVVLTHVGSFAMAFSVLIQPDGKIVAGGYGEGGADFAFARYNGDGSLDVSFGANGIVLDPIGDLRAFILQPDGKLVGAGSSDYHPFTLARFNADGSPDASFGNAGVVSTGFPWLSCYPVAGSTWGLAIDRDGSLVAIGSLQAWNFAVARYRGSPLTTAPTPTPMPRCIGDCDANGTVAVNEIITLVNIVLGNTHMTSCPDGLPGITDDEQVNIATILQAVNRALNGCMVER